MPRRQGSPLRGLAVVLVAFACTPTTPLPDRLPTPEQRRAQAKRVEAAALAQPANADVTPSVDADGPAVNVDAEPAPSPDVDPPDPNPDIDGPMDGLERIIPTDPPACIAPVPALPDGLPDDAKACLLPLLQADYGPLFVDPPTANAEPCAIDKFRLDGELVETGVVERISAKERRILHEITADGRRELWRVTENYDRRGRPTKIVEHHQTFELDLDDAEGDGLDCENFSRTQHRYDDDGWPRWSKVVIDTCEGVDAGTTTTSRRFRGHPGWVAAETTSLVDDDDPAPGRELWIPTPIAPIAHVVCDEIGECQCSLKVNGCDGTELGTVRSASSSIPSQRWRWSCSTTRPSPVGS